MEKEAAPVAAAAATNPQEEDVNGRLTRLQLAIENKGTAKHRETVVAQFYAFLGGRAPTADLYLAFMTTCIEAKNEDGSPKYVASSLWSIRCHLVKHMRVFLSPPVDVSSVDERVCSALKALSRHATPQHARAFQVADLFDFWARAPDEGQWLQYKAISLFGFYGLARNCELVPLTLSDVHIDDAGVWILIHRKKCSEDGNLSKILIPRVKGHRVVPADVFLAYRDAILASRPTTTRLWLQWRRNKWYSQPMGKEAIRKVPSYVANYLFPGSQNDGYRGHSWRPSGATALAAYGGSVLQLRTAGHWQSVSVATSYVRESDAARCQIAETMCGQDSQKEEEEKKPETPHNPPPQLAAPPCKVPKLVFQGAVTNCTFYIGISN